VVGEVFTADDLCTIAEREGARFMLASLENGSDQAAGAALGTKSTR
jgi:hypothetical protein